MELSRYFLITSALIGLAVSGPTTFTLCLRFKVDEEGSQILKLNDDTNEVFKFVAGYLDMDSTMVNYVRIQGQRFFFYGTIPPLRLNSVCFSWSWKTLRIVCNGNIVQDILRIDNEQMVAVGASVSLIDDINVREMQFLNISSDGKTFSISLLLINGL